MARGRSQTEDAARQEASSNPQATRETVESIVVAIILAFLFRAFVAEAFVIPTGSMAPTLQGRHLDLSCEQCGYQYRTGASIENNRAGLVVQANCPICRFPAFLERTTGRRLLKTNRDSFNGDRILVSKFAYELADPERWDVIVFKFPGNAKQNYIKRLIGLPNETIMIRRGDILVAPTELPEEERQFTIARKPPPKLQGMLQLVDDTRYIGNVLRAVDWPSRWQSEESVGEAERWQIGATGQQFAVAAGEGDSWLRYRNLVPLPDHWASFLSEGVLPPDVASGEYQGHLITDYYAYNDFATVPYSNPTGPMYGAHLGSTFGDAWVGDLSLQCNLEIRSEAGEVLLELVEGGVHYSCRIDIASGQAELLIDGGAGQFTGADGQPLERVTGATSIRGAGRHEIQLANVDDELTLWVDSRLVEFDQPATYVREGDVLPTNDDLVPAAVGARSASLNVSRLRVFRDVYYHAVDRSGESKDYVRRYGPEQKLAAFRNPQATDAVELFLSRATVTFELQADQFFPLGDNSPQSKDARIWDDRNFPPEHYVERKLLLGKALLIYWPHAWRPLLPNFKRMGLIR